jgi:chromosome partitioning protein
MFEPKKLGVTQKIMSDLCGVSAPTVNKIVSAGSYVPIDENTKRNIRFSIEDTRTIIKQALYKLRPDLPKIITFYNFKGGVGKTTLCYQVSTHLALMGFNVLVIDADPQGHLSTSLGYDTEDDFLTLLDCITNNIPVTEVIKGVYIGLDCLPSNIGLSRLEPSLSEMPHSQNFISKCLEPVIDKYDFIIFDTNPTISHINRNIIMASDLLSIVVETQAYALNGLKLLLGDLKTFCAESKIDLPKMTIIPNKYEERTASSGEAMAVLRDHYSEYVIPNFAVRRSEELHTSGKNATPLAFFCRSNSIALEDIKEVLKYLLTGKEPINS